MSPSVVDCQTSVPWSHCGGAHSADPRTQTRRHASSSPSLLVSAGAGHSALGMHSRDRAPLHLELAGPVR